MIYIICLPRLLGSGVNTLVAVLYMVRVYKEQHAKCTQSILMLFSYTGHVEQLLSVRSI